MSKLIRVVPLYSIQKTHDDINSIIDNNKNDKKESEDYIRGLQTAMKMLADNVKESTIITSRI